MLRNHYTRLVFKRRVGRKARTALAHFISRIFSVRMEPDALTVRHAKRDAGTMFMIFVSNHRLLANIT